MSRPKFDQVVEARRSQSNSPFQLRASSVDSWWTCPRKFLLRHVLNIQPVYPDFTESMRVGSHFHRIVQVAYQNGFNIEVGCRAAQDDADAICARLRKSEAELSHPSDIEACQRAIVDTEHASPLAEAMARIWWEKFHPTFEPSQVLMAEKKLSHRMQTDPNIVLTGTVDLVVESKPKEGVPSPATVWIIDHKTTGDNTRNAAAGIASGREWSTAALFYCVLVDQELGRRPVGIILNVVQRPSIRYCAKDKTFSDYVERCKRWYEDRAETAFVSAPRRFPSNISDCLFGVLFPVLEAIREFVGGEKGELDRWFPRARRSCYAFGRWCPFFEGFCSKSEVLWDEALASGRYEIVPEDTHEEEEE